MTVPLPFTIKVDPLGYSAVEVNGRDVTSEVQAVRIESALGQPTVLSLFSSAAGTIEGEGIVQVTSGEETGTLEEAARVVSELDPETVERAAIERTHLQPEADLTKLMLDVVADALRGKT